MQWRIANAADALDALPLLLDVVEAAFTASHGLGYCIDCGATMTSAHSDECSLAALESAQGAERPETGEGA